MPDSHHECGRVCVGTNLKAYTFPSTGRHNDEFIFSAHCRLHYFQLPAAKSFEAKHLAQRVRRVINHKPFWAWRPLFFLRGILKASLKVVFTSLGGRVPGGQIGRSARSSTHATAFTHVNTSTSLTPFMDIIEATAVAGKPLRLTQELIQTVWDGVSKVVSAQLKAGKVRVKPASLSWPAERAVANAGYHSRICPAHPMD